MGYTAAGYADGGSYTFHFPDGNASIARLLVRHLIPESLPGAGAEDAVAARLDYSRLDRPSSPVRIRLSSIVVRARNAFSNFGASLRTVFGGEAKGYTQLLTDSRHQAIERLKLAAMERGGNAVLAMRFDCNEIADLMSEIAAYGTAVIVRKK